MNQHKMDVIKEEFGDDLATPLEGWSFVTGDTTTRSSSPLSPTLTSQSVSNQPTPPASTSIHPSTSTSLPSHVKQTCPGVASVRVMPPYTRQGLVRNVETNNNNRPVITARNKFVPIGTHQASTEQFVEMQLKQSQELLSVAMDKLEENRNAYKVLEKMYDDLKLDNAKLHVENKQLRDHQMAQINAQTPTMVSTENSQSTSKLYSNEETVDDISTNPDLLYNLIEIGPNDHSVVDSNEPSTSAQQESMRIASKPPTGSISQNLNKRKQSQSRGSVKRFKKTVEDKVEEEEKEEDISKDNRVADKIKLLHLDCTEPNCEAKLNSFNHFKDHLLTAHGLLPIKCFAQDCTLRFDNGTKMSNHLKLEHSSIEAKFVCNVCHKQFSSQMVAHAHWKKNHLIGQFECNLNECRQVFDIRAKVSNHQQLKHCAESDRFQCQLDDCEASFVTKMALKRHEMIHLGKKPFQCSWDQCSHRTNRRSSLVQHIRVRHFGLPAKLKVQAEKNIVDQRDPNEYVRVVVEG